jgi:hypothetical protein
MFRRERDARRTAKAVRDHQETMAAFGRASLANEQDYRNTAGKNNSALPSNASIATWAHPENVRVGQDNPHRKIDAQRKKGLITQGEAAMEKLEVQARKGKVY